MFLRFNFLETSIFVQAKTKTDFLCFCDLKFWNIQYPNFSQLEKQLLTFR